MCIKKLYLFVATTTMFVTLCMSQRPNYRIQNYIGLVAGINQFDIITDNFKTQSQGGWTIGMFNLVNLEHKWFDFSYGFRFSDNHFDIFGRSNLASTQNTGLEYKISTIQVQALWHAKIFGEHLTIDFGPSIQANSKMELQDDSKSDYFIEGFDTINAEDLEDISKFNVNGAIGLTTGFRHFRLQVQYQYGFTNILNKLNDLEIDTKFKGNQSQLMFTAVVLF